MISLVSAEPKHRFIVVGQHVNKKGELKDDMIKVLVGVRIELSDKSVWFYSNRHKTWSKSVPLRPTYYKSGSISGFEEIPVEKIGKTKKLHKTYGHCKELIEALENGVLSALTN